MHDKLFAAQQKLQVPDLKATAGEIGLDAEAFAECLDSGKHEATWKADEADGERYGVSGTPASFVNGRLVGGAQPYENFAQVIDDELKRKGVIKGR
jgi:protein-disulfide isomerase